MLRCDTQHTNASHNREHTQNHNHKHTDTKRCTTKRLCTSRSVHRKCYNLLFQQVWSSTACSRILARRTAVTDRHTHTHMHTSTHTENFTEGRWWWWWWCTYTQVVSSAWCVVVVVALLSLSVSCFFLGLGVGVGLGLGLFLVGVLVLVLVVVVVMVVVVVDKRVLRLNVTMVSIAMTSNKKHYTRKWCRPCPRPNELQTHTQRRGNLTLQIMHQGVEEKVSMGVYLASPSAVPPVP